MTLPNIFATQPGPTIPLAALDVNFQAVGVLTTIPCAVAGTNALTLTPLANTPSLNAYQDYVQFSGRATATNGGPVTATVGGLPSLAVFKDSGAGPVVLTGGEIVQDNFFGLIFDSSLPGFHLDTSVSAGGGGPGITQLTGDVVAGPGSGSQAATFGAIAGQRVLANLTGGSAAPTANTLTALLDLLGATQGGIATRGSLVWGQAVETAWTPALTFGGASAGVTYGTQIGRFYAIGFLNFAMFSLVLTSKGSSTGAAALSLPAAAGGGGRIGGGMIINYSNMASLTTVPWVQIAAGGSSGSLVVAGSGTVTALVDTNFTNTSAFSGFEFYLTG